MIAGLHLPNSVRSFKRIQVTRGAIVAIILMPLLYSALYLSAFWDPFGRVSALPVALVNSDTGVVQNGKEIHAGATVVDGLKASDRINWNVVSPQEAKEGVASGKYYFSLELPPDFSEAVASPSTNNPHKANLIATYNDSNGYLSTVIGQNVMREVLTVVGDKISTEAVDKVLIGVLDAGKGLTQAADGANRLSQGTGQLLDGTRQLKDGAQQLQGGLAQSKDGTSQLRDGTVQLADGTGQLKDGLTRLKDGSNRLADGTQQLDTQVGAALGQLGGLGDGISRLQGGTQQLGAGAAQLNDGVQQLRGRLNGLTEQQRSQAAMLRDAAGALRRTPDPQAQDAANRLDGLAASLENTALGPNAPLTGDLNRLADNTSQLAYQLNDPKAPFRGGLNAVQVGTAGLPGKITDLRNGVSQLNSGAHQLRDGIVQASDGANRLDEGAVRLKDGATRLDEGTGKLLDGSNRLLDGENRALDGATRLNDGANQLSDGLNKGINKVPTWNEGQRVQTAAALGGPVELKSSNDSGTNTFGSGLAPMFFSMALFIGGIIVFTLIKPMQTRAVNAGLSPLRAAFEGFLPTGIIAALQACVVVGVTVWGVGLRPGNTVGLFAFAILVAVAFMLVNHALISLLGTGPGRVTALAYLMLQVVSSGGMYPTETQGTFFRFFHHIDPMTYAVNGFRQVIYGFYDYRLPVAIAVMVLVGLGSLAISAFAAAQKRTWTMKRLHPALP